MITLTVEPSMGAIRIRLTGTPDRLIRIDRNGVQVQTPTARDLRDMACALAGPVEYTADFSAYQESASVVMDLPDARPRLHRLAWDNPKPSALLDAGAPVRTWYPTATWYELDAVLDRTDAHSGITQAAPILNGGGATFPVMQATEPGTGTLIIWARDYGSAARIRDDLEAHPAQYLRVPEHSGMDHGMIITGTDIGPDGGAWRLTLRYTDLGVPPTLGELSRAPAITLAQHAAAGTLGSLATQRSTLATVRGLS